MAEILVTMASATTASSVMVTAWMMMTMTMWAGAPTLTARATDNNQLKEAAEAATVAAAAVAVTAVTTTATVVAAMAKRRWTSWGQKC